MSVGDLLPSPLWELAGSYLAIEISKLAIALEPRHKTIQFKAQEDECDRNLIIFWSAVIQAQMRCTEEIYIPVHEHFKWLMRYHKERTSEVAGLERDLLQLVKFAVAKNLPCYDPGLAGRIRRLFQNTFLQRHFFSRIVHLAYCSWISPERPATHVVWELAAYFPNLEVLEFEPAESLKGAVDLTPLKKLEIVVIENSGLTPKDLAVAPGVEIVTERPLYVQLEKALCTVQ